jgi:hypothetical protein
MRALVLGLVLLAACRTSSPAAEQPPANVTAVPAGCVASLEGTWHDGEDASYAYRVEDTGGNVVAHPFTPGQQGSSPNAPELVIELTRGTGGLTGVVRQTGPFTFPDGTTRTCTVEFATRVLSCSQRQIEIEVEQSGAVGPDCRRLGTEAPDLARHVWVRD